MTLGNLLSQMGMEAKHISERLSHADYGGGNHDPHHVVYAYEPAHATHTHVTHVASSKHHHGGHHSHKSNAAMSALTLLAFLFFLHILQQCLREHMTAMTNQPIVIMQTREGDDPISKSASKLDKAGKNAQSEAESDTKHDEIENSKFEDIMTRINTADHTPNFNAPNNRHVISNFDHRGFVSAMEEDLK